MDLEKVFGSQYLAAFVLSVFGRPGIAQVEHAAGQLEVYGVGINDEGSVGLARDKV